MKFIFQSDFSFPLDFATYFSKHFYIWSFQGGALNFDGIMRIFIRIPNMLVFYLTNNIIVSYFYLLSIVVFAFLVFYFFAKYFYKINSKRTLIVTSFLFALSPVFLGNAAKIGLVLAAAVLPALLLFIKIFFEKKKLRYLVVASILLNISLIHPFTFAVNAFVCGSYFIIKALAEKSFICRNYRKILSIILLVFLLNTYFILPIINVGTLDKASLSSETEDGSVDYTSIISVASTDDILTAFSFSKNRLKDLEFYDDANRNVYFLSVFLVYILIISLCVNYYKKMSLADKRLFAVNSGIFLFLILLSTGTFLSIDSLHRFLISLPGGWSFRSPLKWQLYMPLVFYSMLIIVLRDVDKKKVEKYILVVLLISIIGSSSFILKDIFYKLLVPKEISTWSFLGEIKDENSNILFISQEKCNFFMNKDSSIRQELNQMLLAKNIYIKNIDLDNLYAINISSYDYIMTCESNVDIENVLARYNEKNSSNTESWLTLDLGRMAWKKINSSMEDISIYENTKNSVPIYAFNQLFSLDSFVNLDKKYSFITNQLGKNFYFSINKSATENHLRDVTSLFEEAEYKNLDIKNKSITDTIEGRADKKYKLYMGKNNASLQKNISLNGSHISEGPVSLEYVENIFEYRDDAFSFANVIENSSFQDGTWQEAVGDCYNYDKAPILDMNLNTQEKTDGKQSLQLEATRHIACTSVALPVNGGGQYLFSFDYQSPNAKKAAYYLGFNDDKNTVINESISIEDENWHNFSSTISVPEEATSISLYVYAYSMDEKTNIINRYDNFKLIETLDLSDTYYLVSEPEAELKNPVAITFDIINPTKKRVHIQGAITPFYLAMSESYHPQWQAQMNNGKINGFFNSWIPFVRPDQVASESHYKLNGFLNGWYVDTQALCQNNFACTQNPDGSYDIEMTLEFFPQRWFYLGLLISSTTLLACLSYLGYTFIWRRKED